MGKGSEGCFRPPVGGGGGDATLIRRVCATGVLDLPPCYGVEKPRKYTLYCIVLYCIVLLYCIALYCIVLETKTIFMLYIFNQMILPFHESSTMLVQKSSEFSVTAISLTYDIYSAFQN